MVNRKSLGKSIALTASTCAFAAALIWSPARVTASAALPQSGSSETPAPQKPLKITLSSLPPATVGYWYSERITVEGGKLPYEFSVSGAPDGFMFRNFTDRLSGQGVAPGDYDIVVSVADSSVPTPLKASEMFKFKIVAAPPETSKK
jgi:hypothetical protein